MRTALYYPYTRVRSKGLLKTALILWDRLEYISPSDDFVPEYGNRKLAEAAELVCKPYVPSDEDRRAAFEQIKSLNERQLPSWFYLDGESTDHLDLYPKVSGASFLSLKIRGLAREIPEALPNAGTVHRMRSSMGFAVMAILAECCAGSQKLTITDQSDSYAVLSRYITLSARGTYQTKFNGDAYLVTLPFKTLNGAAVKLRHLVNLRKREEKQGGHKLRDLRHRYFQSLEKHIEELKTVVKNSDRKEIERAFVDDIKDDLRILKDELQAENIDTLLSRDVGIAMITAATAVASFASAHYPMVGVGAAGSVAALAKAWNGIRGARSTLMRTHPAAYLYFVRSQRVLG